MRNETLFYLQDSRSYVGNDILFWAVRGGYTTNLLEAEVFSKDEAIKRHNSRNTDVPWPKGYIDSKTRPAVDMQYTSIKSALKGTGIKLKKEKRYVTRYMCGHCGAFQTERNFYTGCTNCGNDNMP